MSSNRSMSLATILLSVVIVLLVAALPVWSHSRRWGYGPSGALLGVLLVLVALLLLGHVGA